MIPLPPPPVLRARVLQLLLDGEERTPDQISQGLAQESLKNIVLVTTVMVKVPGLTDKWDQALANTLERLEQAGFVTCPRPGVYQITEKGRRIAQANPDRIGEEHLPRSVILKDGTLVVPMSDTDYADEFEIPEEKADLLDDDIKLDPGKGDFDELAGREGGMGAAGASPGGGMGLGSLGTSGRGRGAGGLGAGGLGAGKMGKKLKIDVRPAKKSTVRPATNTPLEPHVKVCPAGPQPETAPPIPGKPVPRADGGVDYTVWYGTNRRPGKTPAGRLEYAGERDTVLHYGTCRVVVPKWHDFASTGTKGLKGWWKRVIRRQDDTLHIVDLRELDPATFWSSLQASLALVAAELRIALVYIHGYNVPFEAAAIRAAQMGVDLKVPGATAFFSWPSTGTEAAYPWDAAAVEGAEKHLTEFLTRFAAQSGATRVDVIAHSMGNRGLLRSIVAAEKQNPQIKFGQIILAAPDVDADIFRDLAGIYPRVSDRTTLYVSDKDKALWLSKFFNGYDRAGYRPPTMVLPPIDTVEVSNLDIDFLGHSYYGDAEGVLYDMHELIWSGRPPEHRARLMAVQEDGKNYWRVRKGRE